MEIYSFFGFKSLKLNLLYSLILDTIFIKFLIINLVNKQFMPDMKINKFIGNRRISGRAKNLIIIEIKIRILP